MKIQTMKKILFPTEFSSHAPEAFKYAAELAYFFKAELVLLHAFVKPEFQADKAQIIEQMADVSADQLNTLVEEHLPEAFAGKVQTSIQVEMGRAAEAILKYALEESVDLIVMGMTGKNGTLNALLGSTSQAVLAKADCPVLAIPEKASFKGIDGLLYATDFEFRDLDAINYLSIWANTFQSPLYCLHVLEADEEALTVRRKLNILRDTYKGRKDIHFAIKKGVLERDLAAFARGKEVDIVGMITHKRNFLARLTGQGAGVLELGKKLDLPLLLIKDNPYAIDDPLEGWVQVANSIA